MNDYLNIATSSLHDLSKQQFLKSIKTLDLTNIHNNDFLSFIERFEFDVYHLLNYKAQWKLIAAYGSKVLSGPFKDMLLPLPPISHDIENLLGVNGGSEFISKYLLGTYEAELHQAIEKIKNNNYEIIVDIGCSLGYYAAGLGILFPDSLIYAYDNNGKILDRLMEIMKLNNLNERVVFGETWNGDDYKKIRNKKTLIFMDIEGGELDLLDSKRYPELLNADIIVEMHDIFNSSISSKIINTFKNTHSIQIFRNDTYSFDLPEEAKILSNLELASVLNEMRGGPTPWALMEANF